jgi:hypothetical protein
MDEQPQVPLMRTMSDEQLRKIFEETKSRDLTEAEFERNKTQRISALCEALKAVANDGIATGYGGQSPRDQILGQLMFACQSIYSPQPYGCHGGR